jgi:histidyl-tRNA synthetase
MTDLIRAIRGMRDILPPDSERWQRVEDIAREVFCRYGYREMRLPLLEKSELFARSIGQDTDIVAKEMYTFDDRHGESLTLRPEATAQVVRAVLENRLERGPGVKKYYTIGPMFRYERPQKGRYRQFYQINCEALGTDAPELDAEVILMLMELLGHLGLARVRLLINSLGCPECQVDFKAKLSLFLASKEGWCDDCLRRRETNPLRMLDCKSQHCQELLKGAPVIRDSLCEACAAHFSRVLDLLASFGVSYEEQPRLVRGLDYYTRTAFEAVAQGLGAQDAVAGGGRYNGLAQELGGPNLPALGFAIGEDRLLEILPPPAGQEAGEAVFVVAMGAAARDRAFRLLQELRELGVAAEMDFQDRSLKAQMSLADRFGAAHVVIIGDRELAQGEALVRRMATGEQEKMPLENLAAALAAKEAARR